MLVRLEVRLIIKLYVIIILNTDETYKIRHYPPLIVSFYYFTM